ncbi:hypothetical protein CDAR_285311 [Caerostris darwini]|uniref:Uncharacterized protein n=1 Tax=Caerostris darwini TaxID=1538125 RepID=A0AAV4SZ14_9ARAC|nr:hypothetical protein CDAR_285311 [Caerostris darwini]
MKACFLIPEGFSVGSVLMRNHLRSNKCESLVQEIEFLEANPEYVTFMSNGCEIRVSIRRLTPKGETDESTCRESNNEAEQPANRRVEEYISSCQDVDPELSERAHKSQQRISCNKPLCTCRLKRKLASVSD